MLTGRHSHPQLKVPPVAGIILHIFYHNCCRHLAQAVRNEEGDGDQAVVAGEVGGEGGESPLAMLPDPGEVGEAPLEAYGLHHIDLVVVDINIKLDI